MSTRETRMGRDKVLAELADRRAEWERYDVRSLSVFGSFARDEATADSDLDVLVEFRHPPTFDSYMGLKFYLEDLFGRRVDVVTPDGLRPGMREMVEREAVRVVRTAAPSPRVLDESGTSAAPGPDA